MDRENSVVQFSIPGKGRFTLVLQEEEEQSIKTDVEKNPQLEQMFKESQEQYHEGLGISTSGLLKLLSKKGFRVMDTRNNFVVWCSYLQKNLIR